jgi:predicted negative regulator of RcsB-dependent stress response
MKCYAFMAALIFVGYFGISATQISMATVYDKVVYTCWAKPTAESLKKCEKNNSCNGAGIYAQHLKLEESARIALVACNKEFGKCELDYCEKTK